MKSIVLIYDPLTGCGTADGKVVSTVKSMLDVFNRDGYFKSNFGNFSIIEEFIRQATELNIPLECINIVYRVGAKEMNIKPSFD